jgi:hypothetical protein
MLSLPKYANEIMVLGTLFALILRGKNENSSTRFHESKYS